MTSKVLWVGSSSTYSTHKSVTSTPAKKQDVFYENINHRRGQDVTDSTQNKNCTVKTLSLVQQQAQIFNSANNNNNNHQRQQYQNGNHNSNSSYSDTIVYDVPKASAERIYALPTAAVAAPSSSALVVENVLVPSAARLVLSQQKQSSSGSGSGSGSTRSDLLDDDDDDEDTLDISDDEGEFDVEDRTEFDDFDDDIVHPPKPTGSVGGESRNNFKYAAPPPEQNFNSYDDADYGLEVIHEETESQMSSSDSELDFDSDTNSGGKTGGSRRPAFPFLPTSSPPSRAKEGARGLNFFDAPPLPETTTMRHDASPEEIFQAEEGLSLEEGEEGIAKHIRISPNWDPEPILTRLYTMQESKPLLNNKNAKKDCLSGFLNILSGNRKKGTFWNAWKRKFYVLSAGKLNGYEKENCLDLFQTINLVGGKVDFLDPADFVGTDQNKTMTNRIIGIDDAKGHYYVLQCPTVAEAGKWVAAIQYETLPSLTSQYAIPLFSKLPSMFKDLVLVDFGSTNIRAGVLMHQATLPALFFAAVTSQNDQDGTVIYGNDVYLRENRKTAKLKFPFEASSKMCQNNLNIDAVKGFLLKIFKELKVEPERYRVIINLPRRVDDACKKNILGVLFNTFQAKSALLCHQSVVSFWAYSADNGIICDIGERCDIVPVSQGFVLSHAWGRAPFGGQPLKHALRQGLGPQENGLYLSTPTENLVLRFITENFIYTSGQSTRKMSQESQEIVVEMDLRDVLSIPNLIGVNQNVLRGVADGFFDPGMYGLDCDPLPKILHKSLQDCGMDIRKEMSQHIFVTGGCTMLPGFVERLEVELTKLCPPHLKPKIQASPYRYHASFIGASVLSTTEAFEKSLIHRSKYDGGPGPTHWTV